MRRVLAARADNKPGEFVDAEPKAKSSMLGRPLASSGDQKVDSRMALYCSLNL
jgi:hypothetical protein